MVSEAAIGPSPPAFPRERWLSVAAAALLALLLLSATFATGYWVGQGQPPATAAGFQPGPGGGGGAPGQQGPAPGPGGAGALPQNQGAIPQQNGGQGGFVPPGAGAPGAVPQGGQAPPRSLDIIGAVQALNGGSLTVQSASGPRTVALTADTPVLRRDGTRGTGADLAAGLRVALVATDGGQGLQALSVTIIAGR